MHCFYFITAEFAAGSAAWLGKGLSCVCTQNREHDLLLSFDLTPDHVVLQTKYYDIYLGLDSTNQYNINQTTINHHAFLQSYLKFICQNVI